MHLRCAQSRLPVNWSWPKDLNGYLLAYRKPDRLIFLIKNSPDQVEGYLDYLQPLAFAHIQGEAGTPTGGVGSAVVGRKSPVLCAGGVLFPCKINDPSFASFDTAPSPHRRINAPS
jgi:hypothetical protein